VLLEASSTTGLAVTSVALLSKFRAVDRVRLIKRLGIVDDLTLARVDEAIGISLGLTKL
jgi:mRNA-degrading endonuclease toxin of MazEF toxin-antitoxin module